MKTRIALFLLPFVCFAQTKVPEKKSKPPVNTNKPAIDAKKSECGNSKGCGTFLDMRRHNDPDFRDLRSPTYLTLACFSDDSTKDSFFMLSFERPKSIHWIAPTSTDDIEEHASGLFIFGDYTGGIGNRNETARVLWKRVLPKYQVIPGDNLGYVSWKTDDGKKAVEVDETTIKYLNNFTNRDNETVEYSVQIRRSIGRYEAYFKTPTLKFSDSGRCLSY